MSKILTQIQKGDAMKKKQQLLGIVFLIYSIVFPLFQTYEVLANTTDTTKTSLLQTDKVAVAYSLNEVSNQQNLNLSISYDTKSATTKDKVKFRFTTADNQVLSFEQKSGWTKDTSNNTDYYIQDDQGIYPKNGTNKYLGSKLSDSIKNANYGSDFDTGYQEVTNANGTKTLFKKTIAPTGNDGEFSVQLDMLGQTLNQKKDSYVVLVIDRSGSMEGDRWDKASEAIAKFSDSLLKDKSNHLSLLTYETKNSQPSVEVVKYNNNYFTNDSSKIYTEKWYWGRTYTVSLNNVTGPNNGGTPTFFGVKKGLDILNDSKLVPNGANKILITLTDGVPTQWPSSSTTSEFKITTNSGTNTDVFTATSGFGGNGIRYESQNPNMSQGMKINQDYIKNIFLKNADTMKFGVGINVAENLSEAPNIKNKEITDFLSALGPDGVFNSSNNDISSMLEKINSKITSYDSLLDGSFEDPISDSFEYVSNSFTQKTISRTSDLKVTEGANSTNFSLANNKITATNLTLSSTDPNKFMGYRLTYKLKIKNGFKDGRFQQANGQTTLGDSADTIAADYIVPSARYQTRTITASSVDGNKAAVNGATYVLERKKADGTWEVIETKTASSSTNTVTFTTVAARDTSGNIFTYRVTQNKVGNYAMPEKQTVIQPKDWLSDKQNLTFENPALKAEIAFTKVNELQTPMAGVSFTLSGNGITAITKETDKDGKISFGSYPVGKYTLKETKTNAGYQLLAEKTIEIVEENGTAKAKLEGQPLDKIQNTLLATNLVFETFDYNDKTTPLDGKYTVKDSGGKTVTDLSNLMPGRYQFNQTQTSTAYQLLKDTIYFEITKDGQIREIDQSGNPVTAKSSQVTFTYTLATDGKSKNQLKITVLNLKKGQLPETGGFGHFFTNRLAVIFASLGLLVALLYVGLQVRGRKR
jgi:Mg-chelatase subunit ChlD